MWKLLIAGLLLIEASTAPVHADVPAAGPPSDLTVSVLRGETAVRHRCSMCHAIELDDTSPNPMAPPLRTIGARYPVDKARGVATKYSGL